MTLPYPITNRSGEIVSPTGHIRERIGASICAARPSLFSKEDHRETRLRDPVGYFLFTLDKKNREFYEGEWADYLLVALDKVGLRIVEIDEVE